MARKPNDEPNPLLGLRVSYAHAAEAFGVSHVWLRNLAKQGFGPQPVDGKVDISEVFQGYVRFHQDEERRASKTAAASKVQEARAREIELRVARDEGRLCEVSRMEGLVARAFGRVRSALSGVPSASTRDLVVREAIERNIEIAIAGARDDFAREAAELRKQK